MTRAHPALRNGVQQHRLAGSSAGVYAFSRLDGAREHEYVVALNNSEQLRTARVPTAAGRGARFERVYGDGAPAGATDAGGRLPVVVPALSAVVYRSVAPIPRSAAAPEIFIAPLPDGGEARDRAEVGAFVEGGSFYDVTFQAKVGGGDWTPIGTDDNAPYRVFHDVAELEPGTEVQYRAIVLDNAGHSRTSDVGSAAVAPPAIAMTSPGAGCPARERVAVAAEATPDHPDYAVTFERRVGSGPWTAIATDDSQPAYSHSDDISDVSAGSQVSYRATLAYAPGKTVTSGERTITVTGTVTNVRIHYQRSDANYGPWGLHLFGDALPPADRSQAWTDAKAFEGSDAFGAYHDVPIFDDTERLGFIVHGRQAGGGNPDTKDPDNSPDRFITPSSAPEIWLKQGDATIYTCAPPG